MENKEKRKTFCLHPIFIECNSTLRFSFHNFHGSYHLLWIWFGARMTTVVIMWLLLHHHLLLIHIITFGNKLQLSMITLAPRASPEDVDAAHKEHSNKTEQRPLPLKWSSRASSAETKRRQIDYNVICWSLIEIRRLVDLYLSSSAICKFKFKCILISWLH